MTKKMPFLLYKPRQLLTPSIKEPLPLKPLLLTPTEVYIRSIDAVTINIPIQTA
jgi:hypothetical protein